MIGDCEYHETVHAVNAFPITCIPFALRGSYRNKVCDLSALDTVLNKLQRRGADSNLSAEDVYGTAAPSIGFTSFDCILHTDNRRLLLWKGYRIPLIVISKKVVQSEI